MKAQIEININGEWIEAATYEQKEVGSYGYLEYSPEYLLSNNLKDNNYKRIGLNYPLNFEMNKSELWPSFLYDILPSGSGRKICLYRLGLKDEGEKTDWTLLLNGAGNPPGNIRIKSAAIEPPAHQHIGFTKEEIIDKNENFIEYAESMDAIISGATDIQGDAPKIMLVRDKINQRWHPDGALKNNNILDSWIIKFARGKEQNDCIIIENESAYYETARFFGVNTGSSLIFKEKALFVPRFDRIHKENTIIRLGLESLNSVAKIDGYGKRGNNNVFCDTIYKFSTQPEKDLYEYLRRDILNTALRNTDNHGRNTSFLKEPDNTVKLSPLYDFAPMFLDPQGIPRASIWEENYEKKGSGRPCWIEIAKALDKYLDYNKTLCFFVKQAEAVKKLPAIMKKTNVSNYIIEKVSSRCNEVYEDLAICKKNIKTKGITL